MGSTKGSKNHTSVIARIPVKTRCCIGATPINDNGDIFCGHDKVKNRNHKRTGGYRQSWCPVEVRRTDHDTPQAETEAAYTPNTGRVMLIIVLLATLALIGILVLGFSNFVG